MHPRRIAIAAFFASAASAAAAADAAPNRLLDVQFGETRDRLRIAFVCAKPCVVTRGPDGGVLLEGVETELTFDLAEKSRYATALRFEPAGVASVVRLDAETSLTSTDARRCAVGERAATCVDFLLAGGAVASAVAPRPATTPTAASIEPAIAERIDPPTSRETVAAPEDAPQSAPLDNAQTLSETPTTAAPSTGGQADNDTDDGDTDEGDLDEGEADGGGAPALRWQAAGATDAVATSGAPLPILGAAVEATPAPALKAPEAPGRFEFPPPTRFAPPLESLVAPAGTTSPGPEPAPVSAPKKTALIDRPRIAAPTPAAYASPFPETPAAGAIDIGEEAAEILDVPLGETACAEAATRLQGDAYALDAMVMVGFCKASDGDLAAADANFRRLLAYTPDNYEALVGRALIAAKEGQAGAARTYFQAALDAVPPIEESERIADALRRF
ncbi:MAG: hypothetical protein ACFB00_04925 [Parvularculaceae bacterium]